MANSEHDHDNEDLDKALEDAAGDSPETPAAEEAGRHAKHAAPAADESVTEALPIEQEAAAATGWQPEDDVADETDEVATEIFSTDEVAEDVAAEPETAIFETAEAGDELAADEPATELIKTEAEVEADPETEILPTADEVEATDAVDAEAAAETEILEEPQTQDDKDVAAPTESAESGKKRPLIIGGAVVVIAIVGVLLWALTNGNENTEDAAETSEETTTSAASTPVSSEVAPAPAPAEETSPVELADAFPEASAPAPEAGATAADAEAQEALATAQSYVNVLSISETGLREALSNTQPNGREAYSPDAVDYALANVNVDYNAEAAEVASQYAAFAMPAERIHEQLLLDGFTEEQAQSAINSLG